MKKINFLAIALSALAAPLLIVLSAKADLAQLNDGAPVTVINSSGGKITVHPGEPDGMVRVPGNAAGVQMSRFNVNPQTMGTVCVPHPQALVPQHRGFRPSQLGPQCHPRVPLREGPHGVSIVNPGGDLEVGVPNRVELLYIKAGASPVLMERTRGPYIIVGENDVTLRGVGGNGSVVTAGNVDVRNPAGTLGIATSIGRISVVSGPALERGNFFSRSGDVEWTINGIGGGPYRVELGSGTTRIYVRPGLGANINATSDSGAAVNMLDPSAANVLLARPHALSLAVGGGGAQITVHSKTGLITIAPAP